MKSLTMIALSTQKINARDRLPKPGGEFQLYFLLFDIACVCGFRAVVLFKHFNYRESVSFQSRIWCGMLSVFRLATKLWLQWSLAWTWVTDLSNKVRQKCIWNCKGVHWTGHSGSAAKSNQQWRLTWSITSVVRGRVFWLTNSSQFISVSLDRNNCSFYSTRLCIHFWKGKGGKHLCRWWHSYCLEISMLLFSS